MLLLLFYFSYLKYNRLIPHDALRSCFTSNNCQLRYQGYGVERGRATLSTYTIFFKYKLPSNKINAVMEFSQAKKTSPMK